MTKLTVLAPEGASASPVEVTSPLLYSSSLTPLKIYVDTYGCQMNAHDSQRMVSLMAGEGYAPTDSAEDADLIVLNSCSVREKAEQKVRSAAGHIKHLKRANKNVVLAIGGCVAQQEGQRMLDRIPHADIVFGPDHIARLPDMVRDVREKKRRRILETQFLDREDYAFPNITDAAPREVSAFVSVMKGCDRFCTFCIVPFTRGREVSRSANDIVEEVKKLAGQGTKEVVLLGQTVNSYGRRPQDGQIPFAELLYRVAEVDGIERLRFTSPHPADFSDEQIQAFAEIPELCPHMHLPVQSGSNRVLESMRRGYTREVYLDVVDRLNEVAPGVALTTDIILGFPGETEDDFLQTLSLLERVRFHASYSYSYSERVGTRALKIEPALPVEERMSRLYRYQDRQNQITKAGLDTSVGHRYTMMVEGPSKTNDTRSTGRTGQNRPVHVDGIYEPGTMLEIEIIEAFKHSLLGRPV